MLLHDGCANEMQRHCNTNTQREALARMDARSPARLPARMNPFGRESFRRGSYRPWFFWYFLYQRQKVQQQKNKKWGSDFVNGNGEWDVAVQRGLLLARRFNAKAVFGGHKESFLRDRRWFFVHFMTLKAKKQKIRNEEVSWSVRVKLGFKTFGSQRSLACTKQTTFSSCSSWFVVHLVIHKRACARQK